MPWRMASSKLSVDSALISMILAIDMMRSSWIPIVAAVLQQPLDQYS
jgi:hypothetical protein